MLNILFLKYIELYNNRYIKTSVIMDYEDLLYMFFWKNKKNIKNQEIKSKATSNLTKYENIKSQCPHSYGYLAIRPKDSPIPQKCLFCINVIDCLSSPKI